MKKITKNKKETEEIAEMFISKILKTRPPKGRATVVAISGDLGAGKTTFVQAIGKFLKISHKINSPTFVIIKKYSIKTDFYNYLFHLDAYRLKTGEELIKLGWNEILKTEGGLVFVEWAENVKDAIPPSTLKINILHKEGDERVFEFNN